MGKKRSPRKEVLKSVTGPGHTSLQQEIKFILPPGTKLSDIYMDAQDIAQELKLSKRAVYNLRRQGRVSFSKLGPGKIYYFRQEVLAIPQANTVQGNNSLLEALKKRQ